MDNCRVASLSVLLCLWSCSSRDGDKNCSDFACQQDAQAWHNAHPEDGLDGDGDGTAGESLPSCSTPALTSPCQRARVLPST